ncbi:YbbR-like domain-containing protein [Flagellimonas nanhaiensis]|uniref:YbbR-like domain-containing protein n=1 Tax=Flagellimonas nanhaiensis TaxID=2292706 RepID=A0A371JU67_9FLAO|nr:YbbR-like domain-containing protein [Allomuricauda nanhaiensis]
MFKKLLQDLNKRKVKVFLLFLACSLFAWFLSNLSESYESRTKFTVNYRNVPDTLLLGKNIIDEFEAKLRTSGFQFLYYNFVKKRVNIDVSKATLQNGRYVLTEDVLKKQIDQQLSQNISLLDLDRNQLVVDLYQVASREIPVSANLNVQYEPNYIMEGELVISPTHITVKGPGSEIDTLKQITTSAISLENVSDDFSEEISLAFPKGLDNTIFSVNRVTVSGKVVKFSEKVFEVPVKVVNFPEGYQVKTFPNLVSVLCKATIEQLKGLSSTDFEVVADYRMVREPENNMLFLQVVQEPEGVYDVKLLENRVNFVLEQL